jgi:GNAT superfamily N-acetyltransferase
MFRDMGHQNEAILDAIVRTSRPFIRQCLTDKSYLGWFAVASGGRVAAGVGLLLSPWVASPRDPNEARRPYLLNVYSYPEFRKRGLARSLTKKSIDWCREHGFRTLWLHASEHGRPVYESLGFEPTNEMKLMIE